MARIAIPNSLAANCVMRYDVRPDDCDAIRHLVERTGFFRFDEIEVAVELVEARLNDGPHSGYEFILIDYDKALAGYACFGAIPCTIGSFDLYWIAVDPSFWRAGIGRMLISAAEVRIAAAGGRRIYIDTSGRDLYAPTRAFYERTGFHCEARLVDFYAPGDDKLVYVKEVVTLA